MALRERPLLSSAPVVAGGLYVVAVPGNENGVVVASKITGTVAQLVSNIGLPGGTVIKNCDTVGRSTAFTGPGQGGLDILMCKEKKHERL